MNSTTIFFLAFGIGVISGLRALTAPAAVAWAAHRNWLHLHGTPLSFMGAGLAVIIFTLFAVVELVTDQLPSTPARTKPMGLVPRLITGGLSGAAVAASGGQGLAFVAVLGVLGGNVGTFRGYEVPTRSGKALSVAAYGFAI